MMRKTCLLALLMAFANCGLQSTQPAVPGIRIESLFPDSSWNWKDARIADESIGEAVRQQCIDDYHRRTNRAARLFMIAQQRSQPKKLFVVLSDKSADDVIVAYAVTRHDFKITGWFRIGVV